MTSVLLVNTSFGIALWCTLNVIGRSANVFQMPGAACFISLLFLAPAAKCNGKLRFILSDGIVTSLFAVMLANLCAPLLIPVWKNRHLMHTLG